MIVFPETRAQNDSVCRWVAAVIGTPVSGLIQGQSIAFTRDGKLVAGAVFYNYCQTHITIALAATTPRWISRQNVAALGRYAFGQCGVRRINSFVERKNKRARRLNEGLGFVLEGKMRKAAPDGGDMMVYGLLKDEHEEWIGRVQRRTFAATGT